MGCHSAAHAVVNDTLPMSCEPFYTKHLRIFIAVFLLGLPEDAQKSSIIQSSLTCVYFSIGGVHSFDTNTCADMGFQLAFDNAVLYCALGSPMAAGCHAIPHEPAVLDLG